MPTILRSSFYISMGFFISRFFGLARDLVVSAKWGTSEYSDMVLLLLNLPDMTVNMLVGTAITALMVPQFVRSDQNQSSLLYSRGVESLALYGGVISLVIIIFSSYFVGLLAPGFSGETLAITKEVMKIVAVAICFNFVAGVPRAFLQSKELFYITAFENISFNIPIVIALFWFLTTSNIEWLGVAIIVATIVRTAYLIFGANQNGLKFRPIKLTYNFKVLRKFLSLNVTSGCLIFLFFVLRAFATQLGPGNLSLYSYFFKILELPFGILTTIVFSIGLPRFSSGKVERSRDLLFKIIGYSIVGSIGLILVFKLLSGHNISFFKVNAREIDTLLELLMIGAFALPARLIVSYLQSFEYSSMSTKQSLIASANALALTLAAAFIMRPQLLLSHLVWLLNVYYYLNAIILLFLLNKRVQAGDTKN